MHGAAFSEGAQDIVMLDAHSGLLLTWQKAMASHPAGMCVEVAGYGNDIALRDSKCPEQGAFIYSKKEFAAFVEGVRRGEFDHLIADQI